jgi:hypothetical protein
MTQQEIKTDRKIKNKSFANMTFHQINNREEQTRLWQRLTTRE